MVNIYYVRHGQAETNLDDTFMDDRESPLTEKGCLQAANTMHALRMTRAKFDAVYCSPYLRARETCHISMINLFGEDARPIIDERLKERGFAGLYGQLIPRRHWAELWDYNSTRSRRDGIELLSEMEDRARSFLSDLKHNHDGQNVLVFAHGGIGLVMRAVIEGRPVNGHLFSYPILKNGEFMCLRY